MVRHKTQQESFKKLLTAVITYYLSFLFFLQVCNGIFFCLCVIRTGMILYVYVCGLGYSSTVELLMISHLDHSVDESGQSGHDQTIYIIIY